MAEIEKLMKCLDCFIEGHFEIILRKKTIECICENCGFTVENRLPYQSINTMKMNIFTRSKSVM